MHITSPTMQSALTDFRQARRRAILNHILTRLTGKTNNLLSYDEVRQQLGAKGGSSRGLQDISVEAIVGSVGRYSDFTRTFLPRQAISAERWANVKNAFIDSTGVPPIEVYQIDSVYFVLDGNHRVSVARQLKNKTIQAYVTEVKTKIPLSPTDKPDELILKTRYAAFLEETRLDQLYPDAELTTTTPGHYRVLMEQIDTCQHKMSIDGKRDITKKAAVCHWYDEIYMPIVQTIRQQALLRDFPGRTETDLYVWVVQHTELLQEELGWEIEHHATVAHLATAVSPTRHRFAARIRSKVADALTPDPLESGPSAGEWRKVQYTKRPDDRFARDILVPINGRTEGWMALEQAAKVAHREDARLCGLYVVESTGKITAAKRHALQAEFTQRCEQMSVSGELAIDIGGVARTICNRARWTDMVVINLSHPPGRQTLARLKSGFRTMLLRSPTPVLVVPEIVTSMDRALLAYDGSPKAEEALYVATYLAGQWTIPLTVVTVAEGEGAQADTLDAARRYLDQHRVNATFIEKDGAEKDGSVADAILDTADAQKSNLLIMGGYGRKAMMQSVLGNTLDEVLRNAFLPVLVCR